MHVGRSEPIDDYPFSNISHSMAGRNVFRQTSSMGQRRVGSQSCRLLRSYSSHSLYTLAVRSLAASGSRKLGRLNLHVEQGVLKM